MTKTEDYYNRFKDESSKVETKFGGFRGLLLKEMDLNYFKTDGTLLNFGSGVSSFNHLCNSEIRVDTDKTVFPDFLELQGVTGRTIDTVIANQVFEHIEFESLKGVISDISNKLKTNGMILATLPNICNWIKYVGDVDHKTPLSFYHLGALFELNNIEVVDAFRYTKRSHEITQTNDTEKFLFEFLKKHFEMDPAHFVAVIGKRK